MKLDIELNGDNAFAIFDEPRLDAASSVAFRSELLAIVPNQASALAIDLSAVTMIDSSGIGALVSLLKAVGRTGELTLCGVQDPVMAMFEMTRMDKIFSFKPSLDR